MHLAAKCHRIHVITHPLHNHLEARRGRRNRTLVASDAPGFHQNAAISSTRAANQATTFTALRTELYT